VSKIVFYLLRFGFAYFLFILHSGLIPFPWFETRRVPSNKKPATKFLFPIKLIFQSV
jgi:hypothetical protein